MKNLFLLAGTAFLLSACASSTKQTDLLLRESLTKTENHVISNVPFVEQSDGHCGPATLTMVMNWLGKDVKVENIAEQVYTPRLKGSFQNDMISTSRRQGFLAIPITGMPALLAELDANHPVIVFENLAMSWLPQWHYAVVYGYDLSKPEVIMHSGPEKEKRWDMRKFERSWKLADYWGLVLLRPGELSASADELSHMTAAVALEDLGKTDEAEKSYAAILQRWPNSLGALMGMGNIQALKKNYASSLNYFKRAATIHTNSTAAKHNQALLEQTIKSTRSF